MKEEVDSFFNMYQSNIDTMWNATQAYEQESENDLEEDSENERFILDWNVDEIQKNAVKLGLFLAIYNHSNIKAAPQLIGDFDFLPEFYYNKKFVYFGTDHGALHFAVDKKTKKVSLIDIDTNKLLFAIAESELSFLKVLTKMTAFSQLFDGKNKMEASTSIKYRNECILLAGGEEYAKFYQYTVISENDHPEGPFYLY